MKDRFPGLIITDGASMTTCNFNEHTRRGG
jgi:hypothetical protein